MTKIRNIFAVLLFSFFLSAFSLPSGEKIENLHSIYGSRCRFVSNTDENICVLQGTNKEGTHHIIYFFIADNEPKIISEILIYDYFEKLAKKENEKPILIDIAYTDSCFFSNLSALCGNYEVSDPKVEAFEWVWKIIKHYKKVGKPKSLKGRI